MRQGDGTTWQPYTKPNNTETGNYADAFLGSLAKTAGDTASGIGEGLNPINALSGLFNTIAHPIDTVKGIASSVMHPIDTIKSLSDPETGGRAIGNLALGGLTGRFGGPAAQTTGRAASAVWNPALDIAQEASLTNPGRMLGVARTAIPQAIRGLKDAFGGGSADVVPTAPGRVLSFKQPEAPLPTEQPVASPAPVPDPFGGRRTNPVSAGSPGGLSDVVAGKVRPPDSYISDITAGDPNIPGLSIGGPLEKPTPMSQVPFSKARQAQRQGGAFQKFIGEGDLTPDEMGQKVAALNESSPWPPKPGQQGFGMQRTPARGSFTSQEPLIDLVNSKYPQLKVTSLKDFPMPGGNDPLSKAIRQRGHAFGGK